MFAEFCRKVAGGKTGQKPAPFIGNGKIYSCGSLGSDFAGIGLGAGAWSPRMGHAASKACTWASGRKLERLESIPEVLLRSEHQAKVDLIMEVSEKPTYPVTIGPN